MCEYDSRNPALAQDGEVGVGVFLLGIVDEGRTGLGRTPVPDRG